MNQVVAIYGNLFFCSQIIAKADKSQGCGIVEFRTLQEAEKTWEQMNDKPIKEKKVVVTFCIPGKSAVVINNRIMWKYVSTFLKEICIDKKGA